MRSFCNLLALVLVATACRAQQPAQSGEMGAMDSTDHNATAAAHEAMSGTMGADPHLRMTAARPATAADSDRAAALVVQIREALGKYRDVRVAEADGFRQFLPGVQQPVYHFTNWLNALEEGFRFEPAKPTSLLYRRRGDGGFELIGAMYADRA